MVAILLAFFGVGFIGLSLTESYSEQIKMTFLAKSDSLPMVAPFKMEVNTFQSTSAVPTNDTLKYVSKSGVLTSKLSAKYFFKNILPLELSLQTWYSKFWIRALEYHPVLGLFAPSKERKYFHTKQWLFMSLKVLNILFVNAIFAPIASPSENICSKFKNSVECLQPTSIDLIDSLCHWDNAAQSCEYVTITQNIGVIIITTLIIQLVSQPLMLTCRYLVSQITNTVIAKNIHNTLKKSKMSSVDRDVHPIRLVHGSLSKNISSKSDQGVHSSDVSSEDLVQLDNSVLNLESSGAFTIGGTAKVSPGIFPSISVNKVDGRRNTRLTSSEDTHADDKIDTVSICEESNNEQSTPDSRLVIRMEKKDNESRRKTSPSDNVIDTDRTQEIFGTKVLITRSNRSIVSDSSDDEDKEKLTATSMMKTPKIGLVVPYDEDKDDVIVETKPSKTVPLRNRNIANIRECFMSSGQHESDVKHSFNHSCHQVRFLLRLAARLRILQINLDEITIDQEAEYLVNRMDPQYKSDMIEYALYVRRSLPKGSDINSSQSNLHTFIEEARQTSTNMLTVMSKMSSDYEKEIYLAKKFVLGSLRGVYKLVAQRFLFDEEMLEVSTQYGSVCLMVLVLYIVMAVTYVFLAASSMGQNAAKLWLSCIALVIFQGKNAFTANRMLLKIYLLLSNRCIFDMATRNMVQFRGDVLLGTGKGTSCSRSTRAQEYEIIGR